MWNLRRNELTYKTERDSQTQKMNSWLLGKGEGIVKDFGENEYMYTQMGFPGGSDGKESACNAGDPGLIPGPGRSPREGNGYSLQYFL